MNKDQVCRAFLEGRPGGRTNAALRCVADKRGGVVLYSYDEPIAYRRPDGSISRTDHNFSMTTNGHMRDLDHALSGGGWHWTAERGSYRDHPAYEGEVETVCRTQLRRIVGLALTPPRVEKRGRQTYCDGRRVMLGEGGPTPEDAVPA